MQRRNLLIGMGSIAAGGAATIGTGAISSINAQRSVSVEVSGNASANLGIDPNTESDFVSQSDPFAIDFEAEENQNGGLNKNAVTTIRPAFTLQNNLSNDIYIEINNPLRNNNMRGSQSNSHAGGGSSNEVTVPEGVDVQFLAAADKVVNGNSKGTVDLIDRSESPKSDGGPGRNDFQEVVDPGTFNSDLDHRNPGGHIDYLGNGDAGYINLSPGATTNVIVRAIIDGYDGSVGEITSAPFNIRALTDSTSMFLDEEVASY